MFLEKCILSRVNYKENMSPPATSKMVKSVTKKLTPRTSTEPDDFNSTLYHEFKDLIMGVTHPNLYIYNTVPAQAQGTSQKGRQEDYESQIRKSTGRKSPGNVRLVTPIIPQRMAAYPRPEQCRSPIDMQM